MEFPAYGHAGIEGTHKTVLELTQLTAVVPKGDRVVGTRAAYDAEAIAALAQVSDRIKMTLKTRAYTEVIVGKANKNYKPSQEIIVRKDDVASPATLIINADKAAADVSRKLIDSMKTPEETMTVILERV